MEPTTNKSQGIKWFIILLVTTITISLLWITFAWHTKRAIEDPFSVHLITILLNVSIFLFFENLKNARKLEKLNQAA